MLEELPRAEQVGRGLPDRPAARLAAFFVRHGEVVSAGDLATISAYDDVRPPTMVARSTGERPKERDALGPQPQQRQHAPPPALGQLPAEL